MIAHNRVRDGPDPCVLFFLFYLPKHLDRFDLIKIQYTERAQEINSAISPPFSPRLRRADAVTGGIYDPPWTQPESRTLQYGSPQGQQLAGPNRPSKVEVMARVEMLI